VIDHSELLAAFNERRQIMPCWVTGRYDDECGDAVNTIASAGQHTSLIHSLGRLTTTAPHGRRDR